MDNASIPSDSSSDMQKSETPQPAEGMKPQSGRNDKRLMIIALVIGAAVGIAAIAAGYWYLTKYTFASPKTSGTTQAKTTDPYAGWKTFTDDASVLPTGVSIKYPSDWRVDTTGTKAYGWSIANGSAHITVSNIFLDSSKTARQAWTSCAGTDACPGANADDKTISSDESAINGFNAYTATIQSSSGPYHLTVIRGNATASPSDGTAPYVMFTTYSTDQAALSTFAKIMASATFKKPSSTNVYASWQSYTSSYEKLSFKYPSSWKIKTYDYSTQVTGADSAILTSPSGAIQLVWRSAVEGIGGACSTEVMPGTTSSTDTLGPCPYWYVLGKQKLAGANLYYVEGVEELSTGKRYVPWCGLQANGGIVQNGSNIGYMLFQSKSNHFKGSDGQDLGPIQVGLACGTNFYGTIPSDGTARDQAEAFLSTPEMQQAKLILLSATY